MHTHHHVGNVPALFEGRASRVYDFAARRLLRGLYRRIADDLAEVVPEGGDVLDIGTGPGVLLVELAGRRPDVRLTGVDLSADMVAAAERNVTDLRERASAQVADVIDLPFPEHSFDVAVTSLSSHHWDNPRAAVPELARVLRPGGRLYVYDLGFAPFDVLAEAARERGLFTGAPVRKTKIHTGIPVFRRCTRQTMTA